MSEELKVGDKIEFELPEEKPKRKLTPNQWLPIKLIFFTILALLWFISLKLMYAQGLTHGKVLMCRSFEDGRDAYRNTSDGEIVCVYPQPLFEEPQEFNFDGINKMIKANKTFVK